MDVAMSIAIIVLFILHLSSARKETNAEKHFSETRKTQLNPRKRAKEDDVSKTDNKETPECPHKFGYLRNRKGKSVPEECVGCAEVVKCLLGD